MYGCFFERCIHLSMHFLHMPDFIWFGSVTANDDYLIIKPALLNVLLTLSFMCYFMTVLRQSFEVITHHAQARPSGCKLPQHSFVPMWMSPPPPLSWLMCVVWAMLRLEFEMSRWHSKRQQFTTISQDKLLAYDLRLSWHIWPHRYCTSISFHESLTTLAYILQVWAGLTCIFIYSLAFQASVSFISRVWRCLLYQLHGKVLQATLTMVAIIGDPVL